MDRVGRGVSAGGRAGRSRCADRSGWSDCRVAGADRVVGDLVVFGTELAPHLGDVDGVPGDDLLRTDLRIDRGMLLRCELLDHRVEVVVHACDA
jgi:hypothetical protein